MVVDVHYHLFPSDLPVEAIRGLVSQVVRLGRTMKKNTDMDQALQKAVETWPDPEGDKLMASMERHGIDFTVICTTDNVSNKDLTVDVTQKRNQVLGRIAGRHPDKVMALAGLDPRRPQAPDMMRRCFEEYGMKGLKYHPDVGYDPSGPDSYRLLEVLADQRGVLLSHTGPLWPPSRCRFAEPALLADIGVDFPEIKVIAAHMGHVNWRPWAALAAHQPNLYGDLAMWDLTAFGRYELFCRELRDLMDFAGASKVLFGTDNPVFELITETKDWIQLLKDLPVKAPDGINFREDEVNAILGANAALLLGLEGV